ncbi:uncharacterized protein LOC144880746 [Branchiostoma floridae x Branchiostoma japonicum]
MLIVFLKSNSSVTEEMKRSKKRTAFLVVKQSADTNVPKVYVVLHGKAMAVCGSVVEGFVSLIGALYCFQQPHPASIAPAMVFIEHHVLQDGNLNKGDLKPIFKRPYSRY